METRMKRMPNKLIKNERGQALIIVLILLLLGVLVITPLLGFMGTGLKAGQSNENLMQRVYAADAGIEDALWRIQHSQVPPDNQQPYLLPLINGKNVSVTVPSGRDSMITFFKEVGALTPGGQGDYNKAAPGSEWMIVYTPKFSAPGVWNEYEITITYSANASAQQKRVNNIGAWIYGLYGTGGGPATVTGYPGGATNIANSDPQWTLTTGNHMGTYFMWEWKGGQRPLFDKGETLTLRFEFSPAITLEAGERFPPSVAWVMAGSDNIFISWRGITGMAQIVSVATDPVTAKKTTVTSYVMAEEGESGGVSMSILAWEVSLQ